MPVSLLNLKIQIFPWVPPSMRVAWLLVTWISASFYHELKSPAQAPVTLEIEQLRYDLQLTRDSVRIAEDLGGKCAWKLWGTDILLKVSLVLHLAVGVWIVFFSRPVRANLALAAPSGDTGSSTDSDVPDSSPSGRLSGSSTGGFLNPKTLVKTRPTRPSDLRRIHGS